MSFNQVPTFNDMPRLDGLLNRRENMQNITEKSHRKTDHIRNDNFYAINTFHFNVIC